VYGYNKEKDMKKFILVSGGCRGLIEDVDFLQAASLRDLVQQQSREVVGEIINGLFEGDHEQAEEFIEEFNIGGCIVESGGNFGNVGVVIAGEELWTMIVEASDEVMMQFEEFAEDDEMEMMYDFEELVDIDFNKIVEKF
jgi:hypothetical protein